MNEDRKRYHIGKVVGIILKERLGIGILETRKSFWWRKESWVSWPTSLQVTRRQVWVCVTTQLQLYDLVALSSLFLLECFKICCLR